MERAKRRLASSVRRATPQYKKQHRENQARRVDTKLGYLEASYSRMKMRVEGKKPHPSAHVWIGKPICTREEFYRWALNDPAFQKVWENRANEDVRIRPSIDRIDGSGGYTIGNMRWITVSENSKKKPPK